MDIEKRPKTVDLYVRKCPGCGAEITMTEGEMLKLQKQEIEVGESRSQAKFFAQILLCSRCYFQAEEERKQRARERFLLHHAHLIGARVRDIIPEDCGVFPDPDSVILETEDGRLFEVSGREKYDGGAELLIEEFRVGT